MLLNIDYIVGVEPEDKSTRIFFPLTRISSRSGNSSLSSIDGHMDCVLVQESYEQVKRKLLENE